MNIRNVLIMVFTMLGFLSATASTQASAQNDDLDLTDPHEYYSKLLS